MQASRGSKRCYCSIDRAFKLKLAIRRHIPDGINNMKGRAGRAGCRATASGRVSDKTNPFTAGTVLSGESKQWMAHIITEWRAALCRMITSDAVHHSSLCVLHIIGEVSHNSASYIASTTAVLQQVSTLLHVLDSRKYLLYKPSDGEKSTGSQVRDEDRVAVRTPELNRRKSQH
ncbi:hypothetical protein J6590_003786 [Homalodisca vitripennis]|nr:hypothetical protein J6590_003786 [Homalodisca vitripennis]